MSEIVRDLRGGDGPLCPNSVGEPLHDAHRLHVRTLDAFYNAADKDSDGELPEAVERAYGAAAYEQITDRMDLFRHSNSITEGNRPVVVESYWYRCRVCGLVLPATRRPIS